MESTRKPEPVCASPCTVTTEFFNLSKSAERSLPTPDEDLESPDDALSSTSALSFVRSTRCSEPLICISRFHVYLLLPSSMGFAVDIKYLPGGNCFSALPSRSVLNSIGASP